LKQGIPMETSGVIAVAVRVRLPLTQRAGAKLEFCLVGQLAGGELRWELSGGPVFERVRLLGG
jgi:hypothetical protein